MFLSHINYPAVLVCTLIYFIVGALWYSVLFSKPWAQGHGVVMPTDEEKKAAMRKQMPKLMLMSFIFSLVAVLAMDYVITEVFATWMVGLKIGIVATAFVAVAIGQSYMYLNKGIKLFLIDVGYHAVSLCIAGIILAVWH